LDTIDEADGKYVCGITLRTDDMDDYEIIRDLGNNEQMELELQPEQYPCKFTQRLIESMLDVVDGNPYEEPLNLKCSGHVVREVVSTSDHYRTAPDKNNIVQLASVLLKDLEFRDSDIIKHHHVN